MEALTTNLLRTVMPFVFPVYRPHFGRGGFSRLKVLGSTAQYSSSAEVEEQTALKVSQGANKQKELEVPQKRDVAKPKVPVNLLDKFYSAAHQKACGKVYEAKPFKMRLYPDKKYYWCSCGWSKSQPLCDSTHRISAFKLTLKPVAFQVEEEGDYWLCNCKQSKLRPFCDGTHRKYDLLTRKLKSEMLENAKMGNKFEKQRRK